MFKCNATVTFLKLPRTALPVLRVAECFGTGPDRAARCRRVVGGGRIVFGNVTDARIDRFPTAANPRAIMSGTSAHWAMPTAGFAEGLGELTPEKVISHCRCGFKKSLDAVVMGQRPNCRVTARRAEHFVKLRGSIRLANNRVFPRGLLPSRCFGC
jgi:hypothetical protein